MKKQTRSTIFMIALLIISAVLIGYVKVIEYKVNAEDSTPDTGEQVPLSNAQNVEKLPNLLSAEQIYEKDPLNAYSIIQQ